MNDAQNITKGQAAQLRRDEHNHVEKPLLDQLAGLDLEIIDLDSKQHSGDTFRQTFTEVERFNIGCIPGSKVRSNND